MTKSDINCTDEDLKPIIYFSADGLSELVEGEYVLWCDGMGTGLTLSNSLNRAANFIFKLHQASYFALKDIEHPEEAEVYPIADGTYISTPHKKDMIEIIHKMYSELAKVFVSQSEMYHRFIIRGGLAYGATLHGSKVENSSFDKRYNQSDLNTDKKKLLLSSALLSAYNAEKFAPPFGIYVDNSARKIPQNMYFNDPKIDQGFSGHLWKWWTEEEPDRYLSGRLHHELINYINYCGSRPLDTDYNHDRLIIHRKAIEEYFLDVEKITSPS